MALSLMHGFVAIAMLYDDVITEHLCHCNTEASVNSADPDQIYHKIELVEILYTRYTRR